MKVNVIKEERKIDIIGDFIVLSSAPLNGGLRECSRIVNHQVDDGVSDPVKESYESKLELNEDRINDVVGFLTGADVENVFIEERSIDNSSFKVIITAGIGNRLSRNTINIILVTDMNLTEAGMSNLFIVISEAKANALRKLDIVDGENPITGTPTDAIAVAKTKESLGKEEIKYTGTATRVGTKVYNTVEKGVQKALELQEEYYPNRNLLRRLEERDISLEDITDAAFELYEGEEINEEEIRSEFQEIVKNYCSDENIHFLVSSGILMEREKNRLDLKEDPSYIISDELLGINIAEYIGGKKAHFNFFQYDEKKPGILSELSVFMDDVVEGLIAGCMTKLFEEE